jgi:hypothetical protein
MTRQLVQPNFSIVENAGWCLQYARRVFGAPVVESTAWQGWMNTEHPHEDRNFPQGVAVPVWFDWKGDVGDGHIFRYGHAAVRAADGKIWSSPLSGKGSAWFNSVDDLTRAFGGGMKYVGWSEDISNVKVIDMEEQAMLDKTILTKLWVGYAAQYPAPESYLNHWDGKQVTDVLDWLEKQHIHTELLKKAADYNRVIDTAEDRLKSIRNLEAKVAPAALVTTTLKPGLYEVK